MPYKGKQDKKENDDDEVKVKELFKTSEIVVRTIPETEPKGDTYSIPSYQNQTPIRFESNIPPRKSIRKTQTTIYTSKYTSGVVTAELNKNVRTKNIEKEGDGIKKHMDKLKSALNET